MVMLLETRIFTKEEGTHNYGMGKVREAGLDLKTLV